MLNFTLENLDRKEMFLFGHFECITFHKASIWETLKLPILTKEYLRITLKVKFYYDIVIYLLLCEEEFKNFKHDVMFCFHSYFLELPGFRRVIQVREFLEQKFFWNQHFLTEKFMLMKAKFQAIKLDEFFYIQNTSMVLENSLKCMNPDYFLILIYYRRVCK